MKLRWPSWPSSINRGGGTVRTRLLGAFIAVILLTLLAAGSAGVWAVQRYRTQIAVDHLSELAFASSGASRQLERQDARPDEIAALISNFVGRKDVRVLVVDAQGRVVAERLPGSPGGDAVFFGKAIDLPPLETPVLPVLFGGGSSGVTPSGQSGQAGPGGQPRDQGGQTARSRPTGPAFLQVATPAARGNVWTTTVGGPGGPYILVTPRIANPTLGELRGEGPDRFVVRAPTFRVVLAVPQQNLATAWGELAPGLMRAALIAILASVAAAWWLSRSIAGPLGQITRAAQAMARGDLHQSLPVRGTDEVAQLATAFNVMSQEVEQSHQALRAFLANASHELRTPLTSIQGFSQALVDNALNGPDGATEAGKIINEEAERMRRLVEDLLYLSRVESTEVPATREEVDVAHLLRERSRRMQKIADQRALALTVDLSDTLPVIGDADELDRLFGNLLENAGKYTPAGESVTIRGRLGGGRVVVAVRNTGSVIPPVDVPHVFERFYRVDKSRARDVEGSGLGLAIAREVAERHGGLIEVQSAAETGTIFTVRLPAAAPQSPDRHATRQDVPFRRNAAAPA